MRAGLCFACLTIVGCIGPLVSDEVPPNEAFFPSEESVARLDERPSLAAQVKAADGVDDVILRRSGFADGKRIWYWNFGPAPLEHIPLYYLAHTGEDGKLTQVPGHLPIIDSIPGSPGYSPYWTVLFLPITDKWNGEQITSFEAIQRARDQGLIEKPVDTGLYANCPITHPDVRLDRGPDKEHGQPIWFYYRDIRVPGFTFEVLERPDLESGTIPLSQVFILRREGGEPLAEPLRGVDMTGDGDTNDANNIFRYNVGEEGYTPAWRLVEIVVPAGYESIDTNKDETKAQYMSWSDMFEEASEHGYKPIPDKIIALKPNELLLNCPIEPAPGGDE